MRVNEMSCTKFSSGAAARSSSILRVGQELADSFDKFCGIKRLRKITAETGRYGAVLVFLRCETGYGDDRRKPLIFRIRIPDRLEQVIPVRNTDPYVGDNSMGGTAAEGVQRAVD